MPFAVAILLNLLLMTPEHPAESIDSLKWLSGCWAAVGSDYGSGEIWTIPAGRSLLGVSRTVKDGETVAYEFMQIRQEANGIFFIARPSGQEEARFKATSIREGKIVFENPEHDFPQTITYELKDGDLSARIEGKKKGKARAIDFPMTRHECF
jgi:hypothetical protein